MCVYFFTFSKIIICLGIINELEDEQAYNKQRTDLTVQKQKFKHQFEILRVNSNQLKGNFYSYKGIKYYSISLILYY